MAPFGAFRPRSAQFGHEFDPAVWQEFAPLVHYQPGDLKRPEDFAALERRLQELDLMKTNFMIVTTHEMRTPLTVLLGYIPSSAFDSPAAQASVTSLARARITPPA